MKKIFLFILLSCLIFSCSGCGYNIEGVWYGLDAEGNTEGYEEYKIAFKDADTYTSSFLGSGEYYIGDNTVFLEPENEDSYVNDLSIVSASEAAELLGFQGGATGKVIVSSLDTDAENTYILYYPSAKERDEANEEFNKQRGSKLKDALRDSGWFAMGYVSEGEYFAYSEDEYFNSPYWCQIFGKNHCKCYDYGNKDDAVIEQYEVIDAKTIRFTPSDDPDNSYQMEAYLYEYEYDGRLMQELTLSSPEDSYSITCYNMDNLKNAAWKDEYVYDNRL